jgi:competence protein ComEA
MPTTGTEDSGEGQMAEDSSPWGWEVPQRRALALMTALGAIALLLGPLPFALDPAASPPPSGVEVDLNSAPTMVLLALPGLGPSRVERILAARADRPFDSLEDVERRVKGIGPATIGGIRPWARVAPPGHRASPTTRPPSPGLRGARQPD